MKTTGLLLCFFLLHYLSANAQSVAINTDGSAASSSSILDVKSTNKGILVPRLTTAQRIAIVTPAKGLLVYDSAFKSFWFYDGALWQEITSNNNSLWKANGNDIYNTNTGNVGVGITAPKSLFQVKGGAVLFDSTIGSTPISGAGTRMMWVPGKAALRAGKVSGSQWDDASIGPYSFAAGLDNLASGYYGTAFGFSSSAIGSYSLALGGYNVAYGQGSVVYGFYSDAHGINSVAGGDLCYTSGTNSVAMGSFSESRGNSSFAFGNGLNSKSYAGTVVGIYNDTASAANPVSPNPLNRLFQIGNGTGGNYSNAMTVLQNGNVGIGTTNPAALLQVKKGAVLFDSTIGTTPISGAGTRMMWIPSKAAFRAGRVDAGYSTYWDHDSIGSYSFATGLNSVASGNYSFAAGNGSFAKGVNSISMGGICYSTGYNSTAIGYNAIATADLAVSIGAWGSWAAGPASVAIGGWNYSSGQYAVTLGSSCFAEGDYSVAAGSAATSRAAKSTALGLGIISKSYGGVAVGSYNDTTNAADPSGFNNLNRIFQVGNGTDNTIRNNAMTILQNGNVGLGTLSPAATLHIAGNETTAHGLKAGIQLTNTASTNSWSLRAGATGTATPAGGFSIGDNNAYRFVISSTGNVGIANTNPTATLDVTGTAAVSSNLTVQSGMGIVRNTNGTQLKKLSAAVTVNATLSAGQTQSFTVTWPQSFSAGSIEAYVGNISAGSGGWAEVIMTVANVSTTGATLYVNNPRTSSWSPNFTVNVIAIGPQ